MNTARNSPARRHYLATVAAAAAVVAQADTPVAAATANAYELMLLQLAEHRRSLKQVQSIERKIEAKRSYLPVYADWVRGVIAGNRGGQDDVFVTVMVWMIDTGALHEAVPLVAYALQHGLTMPDQYQRNIATVVAEEYADTALKRIETNTPTLGDLAALGEVADLTADHDMPDQVRAKVHKALGYMCRVYDPEMGLVHLREALRLNDKVGVKKDIERLEREIAKAKRSSDQPPAVETPDSADTPTATETTETLDTAPADTGQG